MSESPNSPLRILLVDDSELVRQGIKAVLANQTETPMCVVGEAGTVASAISASLQHKPDVVLLDIRLPDGSGFDACRQILKDLPQTRIVILTSYSTDNFVYEAVAAGVHGYLKKEIDPAGLVHALKEVAAGRSMLDPDVASRVLRLMRTGSGTDQASDLSTLTPQERRVLALVAEGLTNKQVSEQLGLTESSVKNYLVNVYEKLQVKRRTQAAAVFLQQNSAAKI